MTFVFRYLGHKEECNDIDLRSWIECWLSIEENILHIPFEQKNVL